MRVINVIVLILISMVCQAQTTVQFIRGPGTVGGGSPNNLIPNLVAFWEFEETSGNALDSHSGSNTLTDNGTVDTIGGIRGNARLHDDGDATDYFSRASEAEFTFGSGDFTITCWVRLGTIVGDQTLVAKSDEVSGLSWLLEFDDAATDNFVFFWSTDGSSFGGSVIFDDIVIVDQKWYFVTVRRSGATMYISATIEDDSVKAEEEFAAVSGTLSDNSTVPITVGTYLNTGSPLTTHDLGGRLDELGIWKGVALNTCQLDELFNASNALDYSSFNSTPVDCDRLLNQNGFAILNQNGERILLQ